MRRLLAISLLLALALPALADDKDKFLPPNAPVQLTRDGEKWVDKTLKHLTLEEKIGQMLMVRAIVDFHNVQNPDFQALAAQIRRDHIGGLLLTVPSEAGFVYRKQPYEAAMMVNELQGRSDIPLIFAADFERGLAMRFEGTTNFPAAMAFTATNDPANVERFARVIATESRAIGVEWNFFPVADVNSNPVNPIINTRSFGEDPQQVSAMVTAYLRGSVQGGMLSTAKHFPGHGDTATDSHLDLPVISADRARLDALELAPFRAAIDAGVDSVMVAHVAVPALDPDTGREATTSPVIVHDLLKGQLGFQGLVVPDAMDMARLAKLFPGPGRPSVEAIKAGNDMALLPVDPDAAFTALVQAVRSGEIPEAQIDDSVRKILNAKAAVGLYRAKLVDVTQLDKVIATPENVEFGQNIAQQAVTLVRENGKVLPVKKIGTVAPTLPYGQVEAPPAPVLAVLLLEDLRSETGRAFERELKARIPGAQVVWIDSRNAVAMTPQIVQSAQQADTVIVAAYVVPSGGKFIMVNGKPVNTVSLQQGSANLLKQLLATAAPKTVVISLGNPYLAADFPEVQNYICTYSNVVVSEVAAVKALFGEAPINGRLPVSIPGIAARGTGIDKPSQSARTGGGPHERRDRGEVVH
jgi:beta-N-acetylhexosaminidase